MSERRRRALVMAILVVALAPRPAVGQEEPPAAPPAPPTPAVTEPAPSPAPTAKTRRMRDDKRRTMRSYGSNLGYNFLGLWTPGNHRPLLVTAGLTAPAFLLDDEGMAYFRDHPHENFGKIGAQLGGSLAVTGLTVGFFSAGRIARGDRFRAATYDASQAIIINFVYTHAFKLVVRRERPDKSNKVSFPSGHSSNAFAGATVIARHYRRLAIPVYGVATYIAVSRMAANKHHFSDIVAGGGFGYAVGRLVHRRNGRPPDPSTPDLPKAAWHLEADAGPSGDGRGFMLRVSF
jgi:membrane-associated phospholipid phosphatase